MTKEATPKPSTTFRYVKKMAWVKMLNQRSTLTVLLTLPAAQTYMFLNPRKARLFFCAVFLMQFCFSFNYYDSKTTAVQHDTFAVADLGRGPGGPGNPLIFRPN